MDTAPGRRIDHLRSTRSTVKSGNRRSQPSPENDTEVFEAFGIRWTRSGRHIHVQSLWDKAEHRHIIDRIRATRGELKAQIQAEIQALREKLRHFDPLNMLAHLLYLNAFVDPEQYAETTFPGRAVYLEFVALVYLSDPYPEAPPVPVPLVGDALSIQERVEHIFQLTNWYLFAESLRGEPGNRESWVRLIAVSHELNVRYPGYLHHLEEMLRELFGNVEDLLENVCGFTIDEALSVCHAVSSLMQNRVMERLQAARQQAQELMKRVKRFRRKRGRPRDEKDELAMDLAQLPPGEAKQRVSMWCLEWALAFGGDILSFTDHDIADCTGIPNHRVRPVLDALSVEFGSVELPAMPSSVHVLQLQPLIRVERRYFCVLPTSLFWGLRPSIESALQKQGRESKTWQRYQKVRGDFLVLFAQRHLSKLLMPDQSFTNLSYYIWEGGESKKVDLDGLLTIDSTAFALEAKAGSFTEPARQGKALRFRDDIKKLFGDAVRQVLRAKRFLAGDAPVFTAEDGTEVRLATPKRVVPIVVTLDAPSLLAVTIDELEDAGLVKEARGVWAINALDLRVVCDILESPSQLVHYALRRIRLQELGFPSAYDELDWLMHYLKEGLYFEHLKDAGIDRLELMSYTDDLDAYYLYQQGIRQTPAAKPRQAIPPRMASIIESLERNRPPGFLETALLLLDLSSEARVQFDEGVTDILDRTRKDGCIHDFALVFSTPRRQGMSVMSAPRRRLGELQEALFTYCTLKKYDLKCDAWHGIGLCIDGPEMIVYRNNDKWAYDAKLAEAAANFFLRQKDED